MPFVSRKAIPYVRNRRPLEETVVAIVSATGVYVRGQEPFDPENDTSFREIPGDVAADQLAVSHGHYDHADADRDPNCVFPIERLRELASDGAIGGVADRHYTVGFSRNLRVMYEQTIPAIADLVMRSRTGAVLLSGG